MALEASNGGLGGDDDDALDDEDKVVLSPSAVFSKYISENFFKQPEVCISEAQYVKLNFMN